MWLPLLAELLEHMLVVPRHLAGVALDPAGGGRQIERCIKILTMRNPSEGRTAGWKKKKMKSVKDPERPLM